MFSASSHLFTRAPTAEISTLSLHDALPISARHSQRERGVCPPPGLMTANVKPNKENGRENRPTKRPASVQEPTRAVWSEDRKSTRLNSSHEWISYAVFCLKKTNRSKQARTK